MGKGKKKKGYYKKGDYMPEGTELIEGCMSPDAFRNAIQRGGTKSLSTNLTKLGYINCDLAYHHPQRAVMLTGIVLDASRSPIPGCQLWGVGKDYNGRTPDVTDSNGKFGAMISQFDSQVDIEVHLKKHVSVDDKIEVYFNNHAWYRAASRDSTTLLSNLPGRYVQSKGDLLQWEKKSTSDKDPTAKIVWCQARRQWHHLINDEPIYIKHEEAVEPKAPFGTGWQLSSSAQSSLARDPKLLSVLSPPLYERPVVIEKRIFGAFSTGPPGEFVDVGELLVASS